MQPWEHPIPGLLYKYLHPGRVQVLIDCRVRFSQRSTFDDDHELQPDYAAFGTEDEIRKFIYEKGFESDPMIATDTLARLIAEEPRLQARATEAAQGNMRSPDEFGVFCLTEVADCEQMWREYADNRRGFVIAFSTTDAGFEQLKTPGLIGKVSYSDERYGTFLGTMEAEGAAIFFRKQMKYAFEREWRSIRALQRLEPHPDGIFLSSFDPASVHEIIVRSDCAVGTKLRQLTDTDARYQHVQIRVLGEQAARRG